MEGLKNLADIESHSTNLVVVVTALSCAKWASSWYCTLYLHLLGNHAYTFHCPYTLSPPYIYIHVHPACSTLASCDYNELIPHVFLCIYNIPTHTYICMCIYTVFGVKQGWRNLTQEFFCMLTKKPTWTQPLTWMIIELYSRRKMVLFSRTAHIPCMIRKKLYSHRHHTGQAARWTATGSMY